MLYMKHISGNPGMQFPDTEMHNLSEEKKSSCEW